MCLTSWALGHTKHTPYYTFLCTLFLKQMMQNLRNFLHNHRIFYVETCISQIRLFQKNVKFDQQYNYLQIIKVRFPHQTLTFPWSFRKKFGKKQISFCHYITDNNIDNAENSLSRCAWLYLTSGWWQSMTGALVFRSKSIF